MERNSEVEEILKSIQEDRNRKILERYLTGGRRTLDQLNEKNYQELNDFVAFEDRMLEKFKNNEEFTKEELRFIYGLFKVTDYFSYETMPKLGLNWVKAEHQRVCKDIIESRDVKKDLALIYECMPEDIATSYRELFENKNKIFYGKNFSIHDFRVDIIGRNCPFSDEKGKELYSEYMGALLNLNIIIGDLIVEYGYEYDAYFLKNLEEVWGGVRCYDAEEVHFDNLRLIDGGAYFNDLRDSNGLSKLEYIGSSPANFDGLNSTKGLKNLRVIVGSCHFGSIYSSDKKDFLELYDGLDSLEYIGGINLPVTHYVIERNENRKKVIERNENRKKAKDNKGKLDRVKEFIGAIFPLNSKKQVKKLYKKVK